MSLRRIAVRSLPALAALLAVARAEGARGAERHGVVVEEVAVGSAAEAAGIRTGDRILSWSQPPPAPRRGRPARGRLESPWELWLLEQERGPRGRTTVAGERGGRRMSWTLAPRDWGLRAGPSPANPLRALYEEGRRLVEAKAVADGVARWREAARRAARGGDAGLAAWLWTRAGRACADARAWSEVDALHAEAAGVAVRKPELRAALLREWGLLFSRAGQPARTGELWRQALALQERRFGDSLPVASTLHDLGVLALMRGDPAAAEGPLRRALAIRERLAPESGALAKTYHALGVLVDQQGDARAARALFERDLALHESLAPAGSDVISSLNSLALTAVSLGDLDAADALLQRALALLDKPSGDPKDLPATLMNLALAAGARGDLAAAEAYQRRTLRLFEELSPASLEVARALSNLAAYALDRGDLDAAEEHERRALELKETLAPDSSTLAVTLNNLAAITHQQGDAAAAEALYHRALSIREKLGPDHPGAAFSLVALSELARGRGDLAAAEEHGRRALAIYERRAPDGLDAAYALLELGEVALLRGAPADAEARFRRAGEILGRTAPGTTGEALVLHGLGQVYRRSGRAAEAAEAFCRGADALDRQGSRLGGTHETHSGFVARYARVYRACLESRIRQGDAEEALRVLERSRARGLLAMLAERDLAFSSDLAPALAQERRRADAEYDRVQGELAELSAAPAPGAAEALLARLRAAREKQEDVARRIREASPRLASLQYPRPLDAAGARAALDPGTLLLEYSVGEDETVLFAVGAVGHGGGDAGVRAFVLPTGGEALRKQVDGFRSLIQQRNPAGGALLAERAAALYDALLAPAEPLLASAQRLLISPDGPLHTLPFAALARGGGRRGAPRWLAEWKPLHIAASATLYAELKKARRPAPAAPRLVAFGDPTPGAAARAALPPSGRGGAFAPLPSARKEVESIAALYGEAATYLGEQATEARAKALGGDAHHVHFACHGVVNERIPLNSGLVLSGPETRGEGEDNGLLQAWEIFERVRIDAELVTLSACETALGQERAGEGLVGLTRAFQYAGARSVLASLWAVADDSTAELMRRFYTHLRSGRGRDEALRAAQLELIRAGGPAAHPFHWAAFQLYGDFTSGAQPGDRSRD